jgi:uncharacterized membrane protein (UPF0127 family)
VEKHISKSKTKSWQLAGAITVTAVLFSLLVILTRMNFQPAFKSLKVNVHAYSLEVADTPAARQLGLGKRASLPENRGMLFVFQRSANECFWMKDMRFPLDMIWLDANKKVVHIETNVSPATYPNIFCPGEPAKYVIELNAGQTNSSGIHNGETLNF